MSHDFLAIRKTVAELLEHSSAGLHTTRISAALSSHSCLVSFYDVCGFVSKLTATDRRQEIVREKKPSDVNKA